MAITTIASEQSKFQIELWQLSPSPNPGGYFRRDDQ